jgi:DNA-binding transcriptional MerR regulator
MAAKLKTKSAEVLIPDKLYFRIGEVARLCRLPAYVLRFWETEFPQLRPGKSNTGQRLYRRRDVENVVRIKKLLYDEGFTIAGARRMLLVQTRTGKTQSALPFSAGPSGQEIRRVKQGLKEILGILATRR